MSYKIRKSKGFILIEVLISIALFAVFSSAMFSMILGGLIIQEKGADYAFAANLSQEALEGLKIIKNNAWNELKFSKSALGFNTKWLLAGEGTEELIEKFTRFLEFEPVYRNATLDIVSSSSPGAILDLNSLNVNSIVHWKLNNKTQSLSNKLLITNWQSAVWIQNSWNGASGQTILIDENSFFLSSNLLASNTLSLMEVGTGTLATIGYLESSIFGPIADGVFSNILWEENIPGTCPECYIGIQIKTADDLLGTAVNWSNSWSGPDGEDGDETDFYENKNGNLINLDHNGDKWIKYKITLMGNGVLSPVFQKIKIFYK